MRKHGSNDRPPWRRLCLGLAALASMLLAPPARAGSYPESGRPVYLGMGGASFAGGTVDAGSGAALLHVSFGQVISGGNHIPVAAGFVWKGQDNSPGPFGPGTAMSLDWFLQPVPPNTLAPVELLGPENRRFFFGDQDLNGNWLDSRDPEMLGAVLHIADPNLQNDQSHLLWKDGTTWWFLSGGGSNGLAQVDDPHGNAVIWTQLRDINTGICTEVDLTGSRAIYYTIPFGRTQVTSVTLQYDAGGSGSLNRTWSIAYDLNNRISSITDPTGGVSQYTWTTYQRDDGQTVPLLATVTNPRGNLVYSNQYDSLGRVVKQSYADGGFLTASYPSGAIGTTGFTTVTDPRGGVRSYGCVWEPAVNGHLEGYHFANFQDALGRLTQWDQLHAGSFLDTRITDYRNRVTTLTWDYNKGNLLTKSWTTPANQTATESFGYDPACSTCTSATDPLGRTSTGTVNAAGEIVSSTDPRNYTTTTTRDSYGNPTAITNALSQTANMTYDQYGDCLTTTDPLTHVTTRTFDAASRLLTVQDANGKTVSYTYDLMDRLLSVSQTVNGVVLTTTYVYL